VRERVEKLVRRFASYAAGLEQPIPPLQLNVTEAYLRRRLNLRKKDPLTYRGIWLAAKDSARVAR
jgi:hypothetical protein